jgi:hypothetical protein
VKRSGINSGVTTSSAAPASERFRTVQAISLSANSIEPPSECGAERCSGARPSARYRPSRRPPASAAPNPRPRPGRPQVARPWSDWRPSDCRDLDRRESRKLRHSAWNRWRRETSNLCSRSKPPNHQPGAKPPKVGGLGVTPIPRWGRLCFGDRKPGRPVRMPTIKPSSGRAIPRSLRLMRRRFLKA